ncbi:MAG TPA: T9SS type A sorting domain-containing protein [Saprospiraceae bacterium]|nr:T9SS type A sorting domain-containing protein [Saprospiraceae bacterium]
MRHFYLLFLCVCCVINGSAQTSLPLFSDLSNESAFRSTFDAVAWENDLYYFINDESLNKTVLYKVDNTGAIVSSRILDTGFSHYGNFVLYNDRLFLDGLRFRLDGRDRVLLEFNKDLDLVKEQSWSNVLPDDASMMFYRTGDGLVTFDRGARIIRNDTLFSIMPYVLGAAFMPYTQYEVLGLDGTVYYTKFMKNNDSLWYHTYTSIGPDAFYLFGYMQGTTVPGGDSFGNGGLIGRFDLASGEVEGTTWFNDPFLGNGTSGCMGQLLNNRLYSSSYTQTTLQEAEYAGTGCPEKTVVLEARTPNLALIKGYNLPVCGFVTNGGKSFATDADGFIYYANYNYLEGRTYVFKFDSLLNPVWQKNYSIPFPYAILTTAEGYLVLNCITNILQPILRIHRIDTQDGEVVSATELPFSKAEHSLAYYPNPFSGVVQTNLSQASTARLLVYNQQGQLVADVAAPASRVDLSHLPAGAYLFDMQDPATGKSIGQQWMVKR